nr:MAG TPA: hypothetical protein [Caudoviricetes sp.]
MTPPPRFHTLKREKLEMVKLFPIERISENIF